MLLVDSLYINNSGGKVLLDYLVSELEKRNIFPYYLFDKRCINDYKEIPDERKIFLKANLWNRHRFYLQNKNKFASIFCFGNLPPTLMMKNKKVITYFHQPHFLQKIYLDVLKGKIRIFSKKLLLQLLLRYTNKVIVQSEFIRNKFKKTYNCSSIDVLVIPFFYIPELTIKDDIYGKNKNSYLYVSGGNKHKNHIRLLKAWELLAEDGYFPELGLTIENGKFPHINNEILKLKNKGVKIVNYGFTDPYPLYDKYEYLIYPSLLETLGLGQVEAIKRGCKVIASDLPHTYAIIQPSFVFNPLKVNSIKNAVIKSIEEKNLSESSINIENKIDELIQLIVHETTHSRPQNR